MSLSGQVWLWSWHTYVALGGLSPYPTPSSDGSLSPGSDTLCTYIHQHAAHAVLPRFIFGLISLTRSLAHAGLTERTYFLVDGIWLKFQGRGLIN
jgi:hypothetical protein